MTDKTHGEMDIKAHESTFEGFVRTAAWSVGTIFAILIFLALVNS